MCGITAIYAYHPDAPPVDPAELDAITDRMTPRGPDARGTWISPDRRVGLGSRRLAIIDTSDEGTQPMFDVDRELVIAFNGEIYNYRELRASLLRRGARFHSHTDTEVLLQLYRRDGQSMVELLRGMYGFALWDLRARRMLVGRDGYGIKPLYYADDGRTLRIASTVKALLAGGKVSRAIDPAGAAGFFLLGSVPGPVTIREEVRSVQPGHSFFVDEHGRGEAKPHVSIAAAFRKAREQRAVARLTEPDILLCERAAESVAHHLVADVPVGAFLSAGIDSSAVVTMAMARATEPIRTFTLTFEEFRGQAIDESPLAERFARELGTIHATRVITRSEFLGDLPRIYDAMDQPTIDGVNTWFVSKATHEAGMKVALSGLGGDELFGSYPSFEAVPRIVRAASFGNRAQRPFRMLLSTLVRLGYANQKATAIGEYGASYGGAYLVKRGLYMPWELPSVLGEELAEEGLRRLGLFDYLRRVLTPDPETPFGRVATLEAGVYMRNQLLRDTDWASMAHSVEVRMPLVDTWLLRQLAPLLLDFGSQCKQYFAAMLPEWHRARPKTGFFVPMKEWLDLPPDGTSNRMRSWARMVYERAV